MSCVTDHPDMGVVDKPVDGPIGAPGRAVFAALEQLVAAGIESMNRSDLDAVIDARRAVVSYTDAIEIRVARRSRQLAAQGRSEPAGDVLRERGRRSARAAAAAARREQACEQLPGFEAALADGAVSSGHLDALANTTARLDDDATAEFVKHQADLLADARHCTVEEFERRCRDRARTIIADNAADQLEQQRTANRIRHWIDKLTGMGHIHTELDPESHAKVLAAINTRLRTLHRQQRQPTPNKPTTSNAATGQPATGQPATGQSATGQAADRQPDDVPGDVPDDHRRDVRPENRTPHVPADPAGNPPRRSADDCTAGSTDPAHDPAAEPADTAGGPADRPRNDPAAGPAADPAERPADPADAVVAPLTYDQLEAQAFIDLITGSASLDPRSPEVIVLIDLDTLRNGIGDQSLCETSDATALPAATVRRLCCQANIIPAVLDGDREPLDLGRAKRLASPAQRRAILAMYRTCGFPGCTVNIEHCEIHHTEEWLRQLGPTNLDKLLPLCSRHHHLVHEGHWQLHLDKHRNLTVHRPDGTHHYTGTTTNRQPTPAATAGAPPGRPPR